MEPMPLLLYAGLNPSLCCSCRYLASLSMKWTTWWLMVYKANATPSWLQAAGTKERPHDDESCPVDRHVHNKCYHLSMARKLCIPQKRQHCMSQFPIVFCSFCCARYILSSYSVSARCTQA